MAVDVKEIVQFYSRLFNSSEVANFRALWQEIGDYMVPWRNSIITQVTPGTKLTDRIFDSTAPQALTLAASALHGSVTPSTLRWFSFTLPDEDLLDQEGVMEWLDETANQVFTTISESNFDSEAQELYSDLLAFGTGCMSFEENDAETSKRFSGVRFHTQQPGTFVISEGPMGLVDTVFREIKMPVGALARRWGLDKISEQSRKLIEAQKFEEMVTVLHAIYPREQWSATSSAPSKLQFASTWIETGTGLTLTGGNLVNPHLLKDDGRREMPLMVPRWRKMSGEMYGRSPGMVVLPDVRTINQAVELRLKAWSLAIAPPIVTPDRGVIGNVRLEPFGRTYTRPGAEIKVLELPARFDVANFSEEQLRTVIKAGFFVDLLNFQAKPGTPISATEASIRFQTMQRILGPVVSRLQSEFLAPLVRNVLTLMARRGVLRELPPALASANVGLGLVFEGPLARVQRAADVEAINQFNSLVFPLAEVSRDVLAKIDFMEQVDSLAKATALPARIIRSRQEADKILATQAQQAQQQQQMQNVLGAAQVLQKGQQNAPAA